MATSNEPIELIRATNQCRATLTVLIDELYKAQHPELAIPFAEMLVTLSSANFAALRELDNAPTGVSEYTN